MEPPPDVTGGSGGSRCFVRPLRSGRNRRARSELTKLSPPPSESPMSVGQSSGARARRADATASYRHGSRPSARSAGTGRRFDPITSQRCSVPSRSTPPGSTRWISCCSTPQSRCERRSCRRSCTAAPMRRPPGYGSRSVDSRKGVQPSGSRQAVIPPAYLQIDARYGLFASPTSSS
jgi:hypothetical protein